MFFFFCRYEIFLARILLAILDHNFHAFLELVEGRFKKLYSKRSKNWHVVPVKVEKQYKYWDILLSNILKRRADDDKCIARHVEVSATNPQNLAPAIAIREPPATTDLVEAKLSRFKSKKWLYSILDFHWKSWLQSVKTQHKKWTTRHAEKRGIVVERYIRPLWFDLLIVSSYLYEWLLNLPDFLLNITVRIK